MFYDVLPSVVQEAVEPTHFSECRYQWKKNHIHAIVRDAAV